MEYVLGDVLYAGPETDVVAGTHPVTGVRVAIKLAHEQTTAARTVDRLRHEHAMLCELAPVGGLRALDLVQQGHGLALVMERWGEASLDKVLARGPLPVGTALRLGARIARALGHVHRRGIIHRDIKPQNVLVDAALGDVRLIDFGIAVRRPTYHVEGTAAVHALAGTLAYMAPEQTGRMRRSVDARADLYALGATLYQMLTGALPFEGTDTIELIHAHTVRTPAAPHERAPAQRIPEAVSAIVLKLLEKSPEQRYQTAEGAAFDLEQAAQTWAETGTAVPFALGARDWEDRIRKPSRLFGRESELAALEQTLARVSDGATAVALITGPSGVGKSALVHALREKVRERRGIFAAGKFDQLRRSTAYEALAQALRSVVRRRLADPPEVLGRWKAALQEAAGPNVRVVIDVLPELVHLFGEPPPVPELGPIEAKRRFQATMLRFARTTATAEHPLVLFLDDLQWADAPSLSLMHEFAISPDATHLLIIGAYRQSELSEAHPLHALAAAAEGCGRSAKAITLAPLDNEALQAMVGDLLNRPAEEVRELSTLVKVKTDGSPFFVEQFLRALHERALLVRDFETGRFRWDADRIERAEVTDNVVTLITAKIDALPEVPRRVLSLGACIGPSFKGALVSATGGLDAEALQEALDELSREGLLVAADDEGEGDTYAFVHDRVQQAAYEALGDEQSRALAHLTLARELERRRDWETRDADLFAMLDHFLRALSLLAGEGEQRRMAALFLRGAQRARSAFAHEQAATLLRGGQTLLGAQGWETDFALAFDIQLALAEADWLVGRSEVGESLFLDCKARARDSTQRARVAIAWLPLLVLRGRYQDSRDLALEALAEAGWSLPDDPDAQQALFTELIGRLAPKVAATPAEVWRALPRCTDPEQAFAGELLSVALLATGFSAPSLYRCLTLSLLDHMFTHGLLQGAMQAAGAGMVTFALASDQLAQAIRCGEFVLALRDAPDVPKAYAMYSAFVVGPYTMPIDRCLDLWHELPEICEREGNILFSDLADVSLQGVQILRGVPAARWAVPARVPRTAIASELAAMMSARCEALCGLTTNDHKLALARITAIPATSHVNRFNVLATAAYAALHLSEDVEAIRLALAAELARGTYGPGAADVFCMFTLAVLGTMFPLVACADAETLRRNVAHHRGRLETYAAFTPTTFRHMTLLADAGEARAAGRPDEAARLYDEAIEDAHRNGFLNGEALGLRLCGEHHLASGRTRAARAYLREAYDAYLRWGTRAAAARLRARHPDFLPAVESAIPGNEPFPHAATRMLPASTRTTQENTLDARMDAASVLRAAQALSGDMVLGSLLGRMLRVLAENAGAERAVLALSQGGELRIRAELSIEPEQFASDLDEPALGSTRLPTTLVQYVARSKEAVVMGQATGDSRFDHDPYLRAHRPASVLAVPLLHQGRLSGVIYLEHPRAADAFPEARTETVALLASQAATAVENATLYAELSASNERLERQVAERTAELRSAKDAADAASQAKSDFLASMSHELRTPLNGILGYAQILARSAALTSPDQEGVRVIRKSGEHLLTLINDVLDLARIEAGRLELNPREVNLGSLLRTVGGMCRVRADQKKLGFTYELTGPDLPAVYADEKRLMQVLLNLVGNAIKFTDHGHIRLHAEVVGDRATPPAGGPAERTIRFRIEDTGRGIAPEHLARIFEPFEQVGETSAHAEGTGLGLGITRRIVDRMGGRIEVESTVDKGSAFIVTLRLPEAIPTAAAEAATPWERIIGYRGERRTVLIVDDNAENRAVLRDLLTPIGFELLEAAGGAEALALAGAHRPALILMDLTMPGMDGYEATRRLRQMPDLARTVVIAVSARFSEAESRKTESAGCNDLLPKPVHAEELLGKMEHHLKLGWIRHEARLSSAPADGVASDPTTLPRPSSEELAALLALANKGRIRDLLEEVQRLESLNSHLAPWLGQLRAVALEFQTRNLRDFLQRSQKS